MAVRLNFATISPASSCKYGSKGLQRVFRSRPSLQSGYTLLFKFNPINTLPSFIVGSGFPCWRFVVHTLVRRITRVKGGTDTAKEQPVHYDCISDFVLHLQSAETPSILLTYISSVPDWSSHAFSWLECQVPRFVFNQLIFGMNTKTWTFGLVE